MLLALLVVIVAVTSCSGSTTAGHEPSPTAALGLPDLTNATVDVTTPLATEAPGLASAAPNASEAVTRFVALETSGDTDRSYDLLAAADRDQVRTRVAWRQAHAAMPHVESFTPTGAPRTTTIDGRTAVVRGTARLTARLDEVTGLVPARATITWTAVAEDDGWRVAYSRTTISPEYPDERGAATAAQQWVDAARACRAPDPSLVYDGGLVGVTGYGALLCGAGTVRLEAPTSLGDRPNPAPVLAAFGPAADRWARVVRASGPYAFALVLAPFDDRWVVVGALAG